MKLTVHEFRQECHYTITMVHAKKMLMERTLSIRDYWRMNRKMKSKYKPISDGLILEDNLIDPRGRSSVAHRKEGKHANSQAD